jgi:hypothetical protein
MLLLPYFWQYMSHLLPTRPLQWSGLGLTTYADYVVGFARTIASDQELADLRGISRRAANYPRRKLERYGSGSAAKTDGGP